jgi:UDP-2,3-diacylglucosamine pyrophosphatase LpxH
MKYRSVFISDIHLGTDICQYDKLLQFLKSLESEDKSSYDIENLFLVGDIIDMTNINHRIFWSKGRTVIKKFLRMADKGVNVYYIPGNHDYFVRNELLEEDSITHSFDGITFAEEYIHEAVDGKKYLILHGDKFDGAVRLHPWIYKLGDWSYQFLIFLSKWQNKIRRLLGFKEWSLSLWLKTKAKSAVNFISNFENLVVDDAKRNNVDGIIAGHIHKAEDKMIGNIRYLNDGCWTEFCSALVEHTDGTMEIIYV